MSIRPIFAWYDLWVGAFWDQAKRRLYLFPVPMLGLVIQFDRRQCVNHPGRPSRTNLDSEELCQECADAWVRGEGAAAAEADWDQGHDPDADCLKYRF